jgi:hypothetical protein
MELRLRAVGSGFVAGVTVELAAELVAGLVAELVAELVASSASRLFKYSGSALIL